MIKTIGLCMGFCLALAMLAQAQAAPKTFADLAAEPDKVAKKVWFGPPPGQLKQLFNIGLPKRIGLISFYIFDNGSQEFSALAATYGGTFYRSWGMPDQLANIYASEFAAKAVPILKTRFAGKGMQVLTPGEFLDTPEKIDTYLNFRLPKGSLQKGTESIAAFIDKSPKITGAADGYQMIPLHASFLTQDVMSELDEFRKALELDALMVVTNMTSSNNSTVIYSSLYMQIIGPNPEPRPENEKYAKYWWAMVVYPSATFGKGFKGVTFHTYPTKKSAAKTDTEGYEVIVTAAANRTLDELQKHYDKGAKKAK